MMKSFALHMLQAVQAKHTFCDFSEDNMVNEIVFHQTWIVTKAL